jgi:hypothetical protein
VITIPTASTSLSARRRRHISPAARITFHQSRVGDSTLVEGHISPRSDSPALRIRDNGQVNTDVAPPLGGWQQTWRLAAAAAVGTSTWLSTGVLLHQQGAVTGPWYLMGDPLVALCCLTALVWRRRFPLTVATTVAVASTASALATGAALLALGSISTRRRPVEIGAVGLAYVTATQFAVGLYPVRSPPGSLWFQLAFPALTAGIATAAGMAIGARRAEVRSLR